MQSVGQESGKARASERARQLDKQLGNVTGQLDTICGWLSHVEERLGRLETYLAGKLPQQLLLAESRLASWMEWTTVAALGNDTPRSVADAARAFGSAESAASFGRDSPANRDQHIEAVG